MTTSKLPAIPPLNRRVLREEHSTGIVSSNPPAVLERPPRKRETHSLGRRGQTEPLAALVAVATLCLALGLYAAALTGVFPASSDRTTAEPVLENTWAEIGMDGVYDPDREPDPLETVPPDRLPSGSTVTLTVTTVDNGRSTVVSQATYAGGQYDPDDHHGQDRDRNWDGRQNDHTSETEPSAVSDTASRSIAIRDTTGRVSSGTLHVEVHS